MPRTIFISHPSRAKPEAVRFKDILNAIADRTDAEYKFFLSSDWESLRSGQPWFEPLLKQLQTCEEILVLITHEDDFTNLWINFEVGVALGTENRFPKIFVFGGVSWNNLSYPLRGLHLVDTGVTERWLSDLREVFKGLEIDSNSQRDLARLFRQCPNLE
jgi:hypothetical protein